MRYKNVIQKEKRKRRDIKMEEKLNNNAKTEKQKRKYRPRNKLRLHILTNVQKT